MKDQEFLATLKLVSGEEVISMVLYLEDEDKVLLSNPFSVEQSRQKQGQLEITGFSFKEWVMASFDDMYIIGRVLRKGEGKDMAILYDIADDIGGQNYTLKHLNERVNIYNDENFRYEVIKVNLRAN